MQTDKLDETAAEANKQTDETNETATADKEKIEEPEELVVENKELENIVIPIVESKEEQPLVIPQKLKVSFEEEKIKIEWDSVEGALGYDLLINDTLISDIYESPYYYGEISDESEYSVKIRAKFFKEEKAITTYLENKHLEMSNETFSFNSLKDSSEKRVPSEWSSAVSVSAAASVGTRVSGNISADTYWSAKNSPYIDTGKMEILQGATLTIEAGTVITMNKSSVSNGQILIKGNLYASGTAGRPIVFTSITDPEYGGIKPTTWNGLHVYSNGDLSLNYAEIRYASNAINSSGNLNISNSKISNSSENGIYISTNAMNVSIEKNNIIDNGGSGVYINSVNGGEFSFNKNTISNSGKESIAINLTGYNPSNSTDILQNNVIDGRIKILGTIKQDFTFSKNVYNLVGELVIPTGKTLTIEPGTIINQTASKSTAITVEGKLDATGTVSSPIVFTNFSDPMFGGTTTAYWDGFSVKSLGELKLDCTEIRYTGSNAISNYGNLELRNSKIENTNGTGISNSTGSKNIIIKNNEILNTRSVGINLNMLKGGIFEFSDNTISNPIKESMTISLSNYKPDSEIGGIESNQLNGAINIFGIFQNDFVLAKRTYNILGDLTIPVGINLKIEAGSILNEKVATTSQIIVAGNLEARGTFNNPIIFTNNSDPLVGQAQQF